MKRLIINADDLGLTAGVNRCIFELYRAGAITSATMMATAAGLEDTARESANQKGLGIGCHVVLVDGSPALPPSEIPTLIDPRNPAGLVFRPSLGNFVCDLLLGRIREKEIEAEAVAQIRRLQRLGVAVTHLDTHKHTHMFPRVLRPLLRACLLCGVRAIRNPFESRWSVSATIGAGIVRRLQITILRSQRAYFLRAVQQSGLVTTDGAVGVLETGSLDAAGLRGLLRAMPEGTWELVCHPGYHDADLDRVRTRLLESREIERRSLIEVIPQINSLDGGLSLMHFGELVSARENVAGP